MFSSQQDNTAFACTYIPYYFYVSLLSFSCAPFLGSGQKQRLVLEGFTWRERGLLLLGHSQFEFSAREFDLECFFFEPTLFYSWWVSHCERFDSIFWLFWEEEEEEILGFVWFQVSGFFVPPKILVDECGLASLDIGVGDCSFIGFILAKIELGRWHIVKKLKLLGD